MAPRLDKKQLNTKLFQIALPISVQGVVSATLGMVGVAAGLSGYLVSNMNIVERILAIVGGLMLIVPGLVTDFGGIGLIALVVVIQAFRRRSAITTAA